MNFRVLLIKKGIKIGQIVPHGYTKEIIVRSVSSKLEARKIAKDRAGSEWTVLNIKRKGY